MRAVKTTLTLLWTIGICTLANAQTNTFPTTGNVGIGTLSPGYKLDLRGSMYISTNADAVLTFHNTDNSWQYMQFNRSGSRKLYMGLTSGDNFNIYKEGEGHIVLGGVGNVGVGTSSPQEKLEINGSIRGNQAGAIRVQTATGYTDIGSKNSGWSHFTTDRPRFYFNQEIRVDGGLIGSYAQDLQLRTSGTTRISVLNSNGNVGIGTANPTKELEVNGAVRIDGDGESLILGGGSNTSAYIRAQGNRSFFGYNGAQALMQSGAGKSLRIKVNSDTFNAGTTAVAIDTLANVGIGTTNPDQKLTVAGTVKSKEVIVEETVGADFVFEEDYDLPTLVQIEKFIKANKHLEGIASAEEMKKNGVKVGELQIKLLQKIEELTLHTIAQHKHNKAQQKTLDEQQKLLVAQAELIREMKKELNKMKMEKK